MPTLDINSPGAKKLYAERIKADVDKSIVGRHEIKHAYRIKPSALGAECLAQNWFRWRWVKLVQREAKTIRSFTSGHEAEGKIAEYLTSIGFTVMLKDPDRVSAGKRYQQFKLEDFDGHLVGFLDAIISHPDYTQGQWILAEFKEMKRDRFGPFQKKGVRISDPQIYAQVCIYMEKYNLPYALIVAQCKDDKEMAYEIVMRDQAESVRVMQRGAIIINSPTRPTRIAESPTFHVCKMCDYSDVCHSGAPMDKNCRSCRHAQPHAAGEWLCGHYGLVIPEHIITQGCDLHLRVQ